MSIIGKYERDQALRKETKSREIYGTKIERCSECSILWRDYKGNDYGLCQTMGFRIKNENINIMCRMCPYPLWSDKHN